METLSARKVGGWCLVVGSLAAILFFLLQPAGLLIDPVDSDDAAGTVQAYVDNPEMTKITTMVIIVGLAAMVFGLQVVPSGLRERGLPDGLARFGVLLLTVGATAWILAQGMHFALADSAGGEDASALGGYLVNDGVSNVGGIAASLGFLLLSLGQSSAGGRHKPIGLLIAFTAVVSLVSLIVGILMTENVVTAVAVSRACYFPWVAWSVWLGVGMLRDPQEEA